jgi:hypothetical protein
LGKKSSKTKSTSAPWAPAQPILLGAGQGITDIVNGNKDNLAGIESGITGGTIPGIQGQIAQQGQQLQPGYGYIGNTLANNPGNANPANSFLQSTLGGQYLNSNPYVQQLAQFAGQQAGNSIDSAFSMAGRTGSDDHATDLARGVTQAELQPLLQNYQYERGLQDQAAGQLSGNYNTGLGVQSQAAGMLPGYSTSQFAGYSPLLGAQQLAGQLPYYGANALGSIGGLYNGYGTQTSTQPGGWLNGLLSAGASLGSAAILAGSGGAAAPAMGLALSDRRLKTNITKVREARDGLGEYTWNWKSDPNGPAVRGVIADEVERLRPWAFVPNFKGDFAGVNYAALGSME